MLAGASMAVLVLAAGPAVADYAGGKAAYEKGDFAGALKEWTAGAEQGEGLSLFGLGRLYQAGQGVPADPVQAHVYYNGFGDNTALPSFALADGGQTLRLEYEALGGRRGRGRVMLDDASVVDWADLSPSLSFGVFEGLDVGLDRRGPVYWDLYERHGAFPYTGLIRDVRVVPLTRADDL